MICQHCENGRHEENAIRRWFFFSGSDGRMRLCVGDPGSCLCSPKRKMCFGTKFPQEKHKFQSRRHVVPNTAKHKQEIEEHIKRLWRVGLKQLKVVNEKRKRQRNDQRDKCSNVNELEDINKEKQKGHNESSEDSNTTSHLQRKSQTNPICAIQQESNGESSASSVNQNGIRDRQKHPLPKNSCKNPNRLGHWQALLNMDVAMANPTTQLTFAPDQEDPRMIPLATCLRMWCKEATQKNCVKTQTVLGIGRHC